MPEPQPIVNQPIVQPLTSQVAETTDVTEATQASETFSALNKLFDSAETPAPTLVGTEALPTPEEKTDFAKKLEAIQPDPTDHPNKKAGMEELRRLSLEEHAKAEELSVKIKDYETKVAEYEQKLKEPQIPEETQKELESLRAMRRDIDIRLDPDFQKNYIKPVQDAESDVMRLLTQAGMKDDTAKFIQENGGLVVMSQSTEKANDKQTLAEWVENTLLAATPTVYRTRILGKLSAAMDAMEKGNKELSDWQGSAKQRFEAKANKLKQDFEAGRTAAMEALGDLAKPKTIAADATPEQRAESEAHNARLKEAETKFTDYWKRSGDPKTAGEILVKATQTDVVMGENSALKNLVVDLRKQLDSIKASGSHQSAGIHAPPSNQTNKQNPGELLKLPTDKAMNELFNKIGVTR